MHRFDLLSIDVYLTYRCNRRCTTCFIGDERLDAGDEMPTSMALEIGRWAVRSSIRELVLLGGEPTLHRDFAALVTAFTSAGLGLRMVTNGNLRARNMPDEVLRSFTRVHLSIDGPDAESCDHIRGKGAYWDAMSMAERLTGLGVPVTINHTAQPKHLAATADMIDLCVEVGADVLNVHWPSPMGNCDEDRSVHASAPWLGARDATIERAQRAAGPVTVTWQDAFANVGVSGGDLCAIRRRTNLQVMPDGSVYTCGLLVDRPGSSGYVWRPMGPAPRLGSFELGLATSTAACPVRGEDQDGSAPVCIYSRTVMPPPEGPD